MEGVHAEPTRQTASGIRAVVSPDFRGASANVHFPSGFGDAGVETVRPRFGPTPKTVPSASETACGKLRGAAIEFVATATCGGRRSEAP